jgi:hypothetical protein
MTIKTSNCGRPTMGHFTVERGESLMQGLVALR